MNSIRACFPASRQRQAGLSLPGLLLAAVVIVVVALIGLRVVPSALEYRAIVSAVNKIGSSGANTPRDVQAAFDRFAAVDDIRSISGKDLAVERMPDGTMSVSFQYEKRIPLYGPASLVIDYQGSNRVR
ncbi:MAG: DUF4845 domain-containing protein [Burkholderiales bacterium]|jgi:hypothetical protein|nr:MAG: DUF4845 domain-containing protein [Burkholderiales bacterium]